LGGGTICDKGGGKGREGKKGSMKYYFKVGYDIGVFLLCAMCIHLVIIFEIFTKVLKTK